MLTAALSALSACSSSGSSVADSTSFASSDDGAPPSAVSSGNFTLWTDPVSPAPFERYKLFTRVTLPAGTASYNSTDVSGLLRGTDGFSFAFGGTSLFASFAFDPSNPRATMSMSVPGAATVGVRDTITIKSKLLDETETIVLTFRPAGS